MARFEVQKLYIGGRYVEATSGATFETINPANGEVLATRSSAPGKTSSAPCRARPKGRKSGRR